MIKNYFLIAWRNLIRNKVFSLIKIAGLSIGLTVCMLIFLYTKDELSFDQFQQHKDQIYRITQTWLVGNNPPQSMGITNPAHGDAFVREIPGVKDRVRVSGFQVTIKKGHEVFNESTLAVDDNFFSVFTFPLVEGNPKEALRNPHSIVLTRAMAKKYFGNEDPVGKFLEVKGGEEFENFEVTGVAENAPENSSFNTGILIPYKYYEPFNGNTDWLGGSLNTFLVLEPRARVEGVVGKMQQLFDRIAHDELVKAIQEQGMTMKITLGLQPLTAIHLSQSEGGGNGLANGSSPMYSYILSCIAVFILVIACINFINLAIAQSLRRSKEIGIRKVVGGTRGQLIRQFLAESFLTSLLAFMLALLLTSLLLPFFNEIADKKLSLSYLSDVYLYAGYFLLLMATSFIAGIYPSLVLSGFHPVKVLYSRQKMMGRNVLTKSLIVLQFSLAIFLIIGTIAIYQQLRFLSHADLGYEAKNLVQLNLPYGRNNNLLAELIKNELKSKGGVLAVAAKNGGRNFRALKAERKNIAAETLMVDEQYLPTLKIPLVSGRNFYANYASDHQKSAIINESFAKEAGWNPQSAIGKQITVGPVKNLTVVGVVKDYHYSSMKEKIGPEMFMVDTGMRFGEVWVKVRPDNIPHTLQMIQDTYRRLVPYYPYEYHFMDEILQRDYEVEARWKKIIGIASGLFIFISCIGLLGLVILSIEQRTKEIGIRKVLGAAAGGIVVMISRQFLLLISLSFVIAVPVAYYFLYRWLEDFPYRIQLTWWMFGISGVVVLLLAFVTMSFQSVKAAIANPVKSLRTE